MCSSHALGFGAPDAPIGHPPSTVVYSDFNRDGLPDVATLNTDETVSVILGHGDGTFSEAAVYPLANPSAGSAELMVAADFDGDGSPDLAVVETGGNVQILAGSASGTLTPQTPIKLTGTSSSIGLVTADFNADGTPDLAIFEGSAGQVAVLTNTGAFTFAESDPKLFSNQPVALAAADMDGDGRPDLVAAIANTSTLVISLNKASGFIEAPLVTLANVASSLAIADVDGDEKNDVVAGFVDGTVQVLLGDGSGGLGSAQLLGAAGTVAVAPIVVSDVTGDGLLDVVTISSQQLTLFPSSTRGTWTAPLGFSVGGGNGLASVDVNKDGAADVLVGNALDDTVGVLLAAPRTYLAAATLRDTSLGAFDPPLLADVNGDGYPDVVTILSYTEPAYNSGVVGVFLNNGDGTFAPAVTYDDSPMNGYYSVTNVAIADFNGDGRLDIVGGIPDAPVNVGTGALGVLLGTATGFAPVQVLAANTDESDFSVLAGDFNDDGKQDLLLWTNGQYLSDPASASILRGTGAGAFGDPTPLKITLPSQISQLVVADVNGDQVLDLVGIGAYEGTGGLVYTEVFTRLGNGAGTFAGGVDRIVTDSYPISTASIALGDFNGDGKLDVMSYTAVEGGQGTFELWTGDGTGALNAGPALQDPFFMTPATGIAAGDFDGDGNLDLAVLEASGIGILTGSATGALTDAFYRSTNGDVSGIAAGDLAKDGLSSLFVTSTSGAGEMLNLCK